MLTLIAHYKKLNLTAFKPGRVASSLFFGTIGFEFGATAGQQVGIVKAYNRFSENENCRMMIRLARSRPFLSYWRKYFTSGPTLPILQDLRRYNEQKQNWVREADASTDRNFEETGWENESSEQDNYSYKKLPNNSVGTIRPAGEISQKKPEDPFAEDDFAGELETPESFENDMELERRGEDQPDDFSASERKYSSSKYD